MIDSRIAHKDHFETLDLLRGIAAVCVVLFHFSGRIEYNGIFYHGYLAVDFFFCLSGYVIFQAYTGSLQSHRLGIWKFVLIRLIRFLPLVVLGNFTAAIIDLFRPGDYIFSKHIVDIAAVFVASCFLMPTFYKTSLEDTTYPLNGPVWSLFFEMVANVVFAVLTRYRYLQQIMMCICALSLTAMIHVSFIKGDVHVGPHAEFFMYAFPRVFFSFFAGALLHYVKYPAIKLNWWHCAIIIIMTFLTPKIENTNMSAAFDLISIAVIYPYVVYSGANHLDASLRGLASKSGDLSYPLYCTHYPIVRGLSLLIRHLSLSTALNIISSLIFTALMACISIFLFDMYDKPIRKRISRILIKSK